MIYKNFADIMDSILDWIVFVVVKTSNGTQHLKMQIYILRGIRCYIIHDHKFDEKICRRVEDK